MERDLKSINLKLEFKNQKENLEKSGVFYEFNPSDSSGLQKLYKNRFCYISSKMACTDYDNPQIAFNFCDQSILKFLKN